MLKKSYTFGLLAAAALMIAPSAAFAGQTASSTQNQSQSAVVRGENNTVVQQGTQTNRQTQSNRSSHGRYGHYGRYGRNNSCRRGSQTAVSEQNQSQRANVRGYDNTVAQQGSQSNSQRQSNACH